MSRAEAYLPETQMSGRADITVMLGAERREFSDHFVRIDATSRIVGIFEPDGHRPVLTLSLENAVIEWTEQ